MYILVFAAGILLISQGVKIILKEREEKRIKEEEKREAESWKE